MIVVFFDISMVLFTLIGCLKVKLLISIPYVNDLEGIGLNCGVTSNGFFIKTMLSRQSVKRFLVKYQIPALEQPPYSPNSAPCDFFMFPKVKGALKGTRLRLLRR